MFKNYLTLKVKRLNKIYIFTEYEKAKNRSKKNLEINHQNGY